MLRYIILGHMRSGSSLINESLEIHPDLKVAYEVFHPKSSIELTNVPDIKNILEELYGFQKWPTTQTNFYCRWQKKPDINIFPKHGPFAIGSYETILECVDLKIFIDFIFNRYNGFKILYNQLKRNYKIWNYLMSMQDLKIIHTYRKNYLDSFCSLYIAHSSGYWQTKPGEKANLVDSFYVDPKILEEYFYSMDFEIEHYHSMFSENSLLIQYEKIKNNWDEVVDEVQDFLGIERRILSKKYSKRNKQSIKKIILNYKELKNYFKKTKWNKYFEESLFL